MLLLRAFFWFKIMDIIYEIKKNLDPKKYRLPLFFWSALFLNSRIRFHSFFNNFNTESTRKKSLASSLKETFVLFIRLNFLRLRFKKRKETIVQILKEKEILLHKTFCYESSFTKNGLQDPFFGKLTDEIIKKNDYLIVVDPLMPFHKVKNLLNFKIHILPWFAFLNFFDFFKAFYWQIKFSFGFAKNADPWATELHNEMMHATTYFHLLFYLAFSRIFKSLKVKTYHLTFENNSWEKVTILACRESSQSAIIIGFQHSVVPESTLGMRFLDWEVENNLLPNQIFTTGLETANILREFNLEIATNNLPTIEPLCAFRYEYLYQIKPKINPINKKILVAVEAVASAKTMINIILSAKDYFTQNNFSLVFRFHPAMPYREFKNYINYQELESFATVSIAPLLTDIEQTDLTIYWGSTVSLESSFAGNPILNYRDQFFLSHDPLFKIQHLKRSFSDKRELISSIEYFLALEDNCLHNERAQCRQYIKNYFYQPKQNHYDKLLGMFK